MKKMNWIIFAVFVFKSYSVLACTACWGKVIDQGDDQVQEFLKKKTDSIRGTDPLKPVCDFRNGNEACKPSK